MFGAIGKEAAWKPPHQKGKGTMVLSRRTEWDSQRKCQGIRGTDSPSEGHHISVRQMDYFGGDFQ